MIFLLADAWEAEVEARSLVLDAHTLVVVELGEMRVRVLGVCGSVGDELRLDHF